MIGGQRRRSHQYFLCRGKPKFSSPAKQLREVASRNFPYHQLRNRTPGLIQSVVSHAATLLEQNYLDRVAAARIAETNTTTNLDTDTNKSVHHVIDFALALDLDRRPRMNRMGTEIISTHRKVQADQIARLMALKTAELWGWKDDSLDGRRRMRIAKAACRQVAYDFGYEKTFTGSRLTVWELSLADGISIGTTQKSLCSPENGGSEAYVDKIEGTFLLYKGIQ